ncbi:MAG: glutamate--tRNA ligase [Candidatus Paceibacterota bacterium]
MNKETQQKILRFAPSPTGLLHIGSVRTAFFNYLYTKKNNAKLILRFEDTDTERSKKEFEENILEGFEWLGITFDEIHRQSERTEIYAKHIQNLLNSGAAYISQGESGERKSVIRFKNPNKVVTFTDEIRGAVTFDTTELKDFVIAKSETEPLYHLAVVVDDFEMGVTHIIRGEDHISNTPRQILILEALGAPRPSYAHIPMILAADRSKMSKRHGTVAITEYRNQGFLPQSILNYLALLGWNPGGEKEVFTLTELIELFDLSRVHKSGAIFSMEKMKWFNSEHLKILTPEIKRDALISHLKNSDDVSDDFTLLASKNNLFLDVLFERIEILDDAVVHAREGEYDYLWSETFVEKKTLLWKDETAEATIQRLEKVVVLLEKVQNFDNPEEIKESIWDYATKEGRGQVLSPVRTALSGKERSLDPFTISAIIGKIETIGRLKRAIRVLSTS